MALSNTPKLYPEDEIMSVLKEAMGAGVTWQDVDKIKDHIAALERERDACHAQWLDCRDANTQLHVELACTQHETKAAVADNAALYSDLREASRGLNAPLIMRIQFTLDQPHPGAALLERLKTLEAREKAWRDVAGVLYRAAPPCVRAATEGEESEWRDACYEYARLRAVIEEA